MSTELRRLPDSELEVMLALWDCGGEASRSQIEEKLSDFHWAVNTINTFLTRLCAALFQASLPLFPTATKSTKTR